MLYKPDNQPQWTNERKILTREQLHIPSLHMIGYANFPSTSKALATHYHCSMEFVVILNGKQQYVVDGRRYTLYGGDIFMTYPYESHGNGNTLQELCEFIWFQLDMSSPQNFLGLLPAYAQYLFEQCLNYRCRTKKADAKELAALRRAFALLSSENYQKQILGYSDFLRFITNNIFTGTTDLKKDGCSPDIQRALAYIHAHSTEDLDMQEIAYGCGLSLSHFKAKFKNQLGRTPHAYIVALKIDAAKQLLESPENTVTDIAFRLNFSSSHHFSTVFKKHTGYTPTAFREQHFPKRH